MSVTFHTPTVVLNDTCKPHQIKITVAPPNSNLIQRFMRREKIGDILLDPKLDSKAQAAGTTFAPVKFRSVVEHDTGIRRQVETPKRVKPWWFTTESGKLALSVRYGTKVLELAKGKVAVEVGAEKDLVPTLELIKTAVLNGELDTQIEAAANKLRDGFSQ